MDVQVFSGRQRGSHIFHCGDGLHYNVREVRGDRARLHCRHYKSRGRGCPGTASVSLVTGLLTHNQDHNHNPDPLLSDDFELRRLMVHEARTNFFGRRIKNILNDLKVRCGTPALAMRFTSVRMSSALYAARSETYPAIPKTLIHLGILIGQPNMRPVCTTADGADFMFQGVVGCIQNRTVALVFVSGRMLQFLSTCENIHADGTFKKRSRKPRMAQIFNIVTKFGDNIIALVRVLMTSRTTEAYSAVLTYLKTLAPNWHPRRIHCDFERAEMAAFHQAFPIARVVGCLWHYGVAFSSYARQLGLAGVANENPVVKSFIRCLGGAPLLPQYQIWQGVEEIWRQVEASGWSDELLPLFQYFEREWKPRIPDLCVFGLSDRTNNCSESDNHALGTEIPQCHPNIWHLIGAFVRLEFVAYCDMLAIRAGRPVTGAPKWKTVWNNTNVKRTSQLLVSQQITPGQFLEQASFANLAAVNHGLRIGNDSDSEDSDAD